MGFIDNWKMVSITTESSKYSEPFYNLALSVEYEMDDGIPIEIALTCANMFLRLEQSFNLYFNKGIKSHKNEAIKFLVAFSSFSFGKDKIVWSWQSVRQQSQGLYESMENSPAHFLKYNTPIIELVIGEVETFVSENS